MRLVHDIDTLLSICRQQSKKSTGPDEIPWCPWVPNSPMQRVLAYDTRPVLLAEGGTGGGKSVGLAMAVLRNVAAGGSVLVLRKTFPALMAVRGPVWLFDQWLPATDAKWRGKLL